MHKVIPIQKQFYIYLLLQEKNNDYNTFDKVVVIAESEEQAKTIYPDLTEDYAVEFITDIRKTNRKDILDFHWVDNPKDVIVKLLGIAEAEYDKPTVICAHFHTWED